MDVEKLLITLMPNVVKAFLPGCRYVGLIDYEVCFMLPVVHLYLYL